VRLSCLFLQTNAIDMKHGLQYFLLIGFILTMTGQLIAQEQLNQTDSRGRKQGEWKGTFPNGKTRYTGQFHNDIPQGEFRYYFLSGELRSVNVFSQNGKVAHNRTYFENNFLMAEGKYFNQKKDSTWRFYSDIDGNLLSEEDYMNDLRHGAIKNYYPDNGKLLEVIHYTEGKKNGSWQKYFEEGGLIVEGSYLDDLLDGPIQFFYASGVTQIKGQYINGMKNGKWMYFTEEGKLDYEENYEMGVLR